MKSIYSHEQVFKARYQFEDIITNSLEMHQLINTCKEIADSEIGILITGESGTGKELLAQSIHNASKRRFKPFVAINCAALPESLIESELFGYTSGTFTGSIKTGKQGLFEQAQGGTVFLDEVGEISLPLQAKLLRVLQEREFMPIGGEKLIQLDVRIIAATNRELFDMIQRGQFREDLYYRINVFPIHIPPLRERSSDILPLMNSIIGRKLTFDQEALAFIHQYHWPGNIRELVNAAQYMKMIMKSSHVTLRNLPPYVIENYASCENEYKNNPIYEVEFLCERGVLKEALLVMKFIAYFNSLNLTSGRTNLLRKLYEQDEMISDAKLKSILKYLKFLELIQTNTVRKGSLLTARGQIIMNLLDKT